MGQITTLARSLLTGGIGVQDARRLINEANKGGITDAEKAELRGLITSAEFADKFTLRGRQTLEAFLGGATPLPPPPPPPPTDGFQITGDQRNGITGMATPGAIIEAINLTTAPEGRLHMEDAVEIGRADASGRFTGRIGDLQEGDQIRIRSRKPDGTVSDWVTLNAKGLATADTRNAVVAMYRIGLTDAGSGRVNVTNINASRQVSEPGAQLQFTNVRTGAKTAVTIDDKGGFPDGFSVPGQPGDTFSVAATDGKNNRDFRAETGRLTVPGGAASGTDLIPDPALHKDELNTDGTPRFGKKTFTGPLVRDGIKPEDVAQGQIGDCYFPSAVAAIAHKDPDKLLRLMKDNGDGTYTFTFQKNDWSTGRFKAEEVKVDGDLWVRSYGAPLYGTSNHPDKGERSMETWFPLLEKAYAQWKGSYNAIGNGGSAGTVMQDLLGSDSKSSWISSGRNDDDVWSKVKKATDSSWPMSAGTYGETQDAMYSGTGVYANHSYSVLGYEERAGERYVKLRNPWGQSEPSGNGENDGFFSLKLSEFTKLYQNLNWVEA